MLPPSDPEWTDVSRPGVSRPLQVPAGDVYPTGTDRTITLAATAAADSQDGESRVTQRSRLMKRKR
jgi:hypothetical protein